MSETRAEDRDLVWLSGSLLPRSAARISPRDRGLLLADGLFETMWARGAHIVRLPHHAARLAAGARALGLPAPPSAASIAVAAVDLLAARGMDDAGAHAALRLTFTRGAGGRGLSPSRMGVDGREAATVLLDASVLPRPPGNEPPAAAILSRHPVAPSPLSPHKTLAYTGAVAARREARRAGADLALRLNPAGRLAGADAANLFLLLGRALHTPPLSEGALAGTVRAALLALAPSAGLRAYVAPVRVEEIHAADAVFVTSALTGLRRVDHFDGRRVGRGDASVEARWARLAAALAADDCDCAHDGA